MKRNNVSKTIVCAIITLIMAIASVAGLLPAFSQVSAVSSSRLPAPQNLSYSLTSSKIKISWDEVTGAAGYVIFRKTNSGWNRLKAVRNTYAYVSGLKPGPNYCFKVTAIQKVNGKYYRGYYSDELLIHLNSDVFNENGSSNAVSSGANAYPQNAFANYYRQNIRPTTDNSGLTGIESSQAVIANAGVYGDQVMLVKQVYTDGNYDISLYCYSSGRIVQAGGGPLADSVDDYGNELYFVKELDTGRYYLHYSWHDGINNSEYRICSVESNGLFTVHTVTSLGGIIYTIDGSPADSGEYKMFNNNYEKADTGTDEIVLLA